MEICKKWASEPLHSQLLEMHHGEQKTCQIKRNSNERPIPLLIYNEVKDCIPFIISKYSFVQQKFIGMITIAGLMCRKNALVQVGEYLYIMSELRDFVNPTPTVIDFTRILYFRSEWYKSKDSKRFSLFISSDNKLQLAIQRDNNNKYEVCMYTFDASRFIEKEVIAYERFICQINSIFSYLFSGPLLRKGRQSLTCYGPWWSTIRFLLEYR